jgi:two-component system, OmpR family, alkaline phosphatase synthesis response regulator PhoP
VDCARHEVHKGGRLTELTPSEFDLLRVFLENRGKVLSIDELLKRVRGPDVFLTDRVIYTHLNNLRNKIEDLPSKPKYLVSVRGVGWRGLPL